MNVQEEAIAAASLGWKSQAAPIIFLVVALLPLSLVICAPAARAQSWGEVVLHAFELSDGADPVGLIQGRDGNFYGVTWGGGENMGRDGMNFVGTLFKLTPQGTLTTRPLVLQPG